MSYNFLKFFIAFFIINSSSNMIDDENKEIIEENHLRSLKPTPLLDSKTKNSGSLKLQSKLFQTLYSDSYSNNYYYTTLYIGPNKIKQTYIIDTSSAVMSSPCNTCKDCGKHKKNYYDSSNKKAYKPLKCSSKICKMVNPSGCNAKKDDLEKKKCSFYTKKSNGEGLEGHYLSNIVYFEEDKSYKKNKKVYRSYALPLGCTTKEFGKFKSYKADGVMGLNNDKGSFINVLYNLKIINNNIFSLCLGLEGGYMSLGEIDKTYHKEKSIKYFSFTTSNNLYSFNVYGVTVGKNKKKSFKFQGVIDSSRAHTYIPEKQYKTIYNEFTEFCKKKGKNKCGKFQYDSQLGYCASFKDRESLFKAVNGNWPDISFNLPNSTVYTWKPIDYYYYYIQGDIRKACLGFKSYDEDNIIFGSNFMHGKDIIFDRNKKIIGFVKSDCSKRTIMLKGLLKGKNKGDDDASIDKEIHKNEKEGKYKLGDEEGQSAVEFVQGHNKELDDGSDFKFFNFVILLSSILIVVIVILVVVIALMCKKKEFSLYENISTEPNESSNPRKLEEIAEDNKPTSEEVQFLRKMMKINQK